MHSCCEYYCLLDDGSGADVRVQVRNPVAVDEVKRKGKRRSCQQSFSFFFFFFFSYAEAAENKVQRRDRGSGGGGEEESEGMNEGVGVAGGVVGQRASKQLGVLGEGGGIKTKAKAARRMGGGAGKGRNKNMGNGSLGWVQKICSGRVLAGGCGFGA